MTAWSVAMWTRRPKPGTDSSLRYSWLDPSGDSIAAYEIGSPTAVPASRKPSWLRAELGAEGVSVALGVAVAEERTGGDDVPVRSHSAHAPAARTGASRAGMSNRCIMIAPAATQS